MQENDDERLTDDSHESDALWLSEFESLETAEFRNRK